MDSKVRELLEDEMARYDGRYYDAGVWCGLNWVVEEAEKAAKMERTDELSAVGKQKKFVLEELDKAEKECRHVKEKHIGIGRDRAEMYEVDAYRQKASTKLQFYSGVLEGLEKAIDILKEARA